MKSLKKGKLPIVNAKGQVLNPLFSHCWECRCNATWKSEFKLPRREAGPPNHPKSLTQENNGTIEEGISGEWANLIILGHSNLVGSPNKVTMPQPICAIDRSTRCILRSKSLTQENNHTIDEGIFYLVKSYGEA